MGFAKTQSVLGSANDKFRMVGASCLWGGCAACRACAQSLSPLSSSAVSSSSQSSSTPPQVMSNKQNRNIALICAASAALLLLYWWFAR